MSGAENIKRKRGRPKVADPKAAKTRARRAYQKRQRERREYMELLNEAADKVRDAMLSSTAGQLILPMDLAQEDTVATLNNVAAFIEAESKREQRHQDKKHAAGY